MKPNKAMQHLQFIVDNQKTVNTGKIKEMVDVVVSHNKMLQVDNNRLRKKIKRMKRRNENE